MDTKNINTDVELLDLLISIWKRKIFIIAGTVLTIVLCILILSFMTQIYKNVMVLRPGVIDITDGGTQIYLDSASNIAALINSGAYDEKIIQSFNGDELDNMSTDLTFNVLIPDKTNIINVEFEFSDKKTGISVLKKLYDLLVQRYNYRVETSQKTIARDIKTAKTILSNNKYQIKLLESKISSAAVEKKKEEAALQGSISQLKTTLDVLNTQHDNNRARIKKTKIEYETISKNNSDLYKQQSLILNDSIDQENILSTMVYNNIVQGNVSNADKLANLLIELNTRAGELEISAEETRQAINDKLVEKELIEKNFKIIIEDINAQIEDKKVDQLEKIARIELLELKRENCTNIVLVQPPLSGNFPVKPRKLMILVISAVAGFLFFIFVSVVLSIVKKEI